MPLVGPASPGGFRRGRRRGLVVGAAVGSAAARRNNKSEEDTPAPAAPATDDQMAQLEKLGQLHKDGILTDEEFSAKKKQILGL